MKTLVIVSGGDAPGINAFIWHYTVLAVAHGDSVIGALGGFPGLLAGQVIDLTPPMLGTWAGQGGTILPSSREPVLDQPAAETRLKEVLQQHGVDRMVLFGGDGTLRYIPPRLARWNIPFIGIPTTIDNNVPGTDETLGFDSACNYAYSAIDGIRATAHALQGRIFLVETLGGDCGNLALAIALGAGADAVLLPEYAYDLPRLGARLLEAVECKHHALLVVCEGVPEGRSLPQRIPEWTKVRVRDTRLGHGQRAGMTSHRDRSLAAQMAQLAYEAQQVAVGVVVVQGGRVMLHEGLLDGFSARLPDLALYKRINGL